MNGGGARSLSRAEKIDWLRLIRSENVGPLTFYRLLERFGTAAAALEALPDLARRGGRAARIKMGARAVAERELGDLEALGALLVARGETAYPPLLAHIEDAPPLISVHGNDHLLQKPSIAVIGARNASLNGRRFAERLATDLGTAGLVVISGLARGIAAAAHVGALDTGTVAVLGGGIDIVYPKENQGLHEDIVERGVMIAEPPPGTVPQARLFPRRNRIISGISHGVVVVEASLRSGSLITARMALEQGREVFAVPGSPLDPRARGANHLLRQGAALVESAADVLAVLNEAPGIPLLEPEPIDFIHRPAQLPDPSEIDLARQSVHECLGPAPLEVDEIIRSCQISPSVVSMVLLELELAGRLERHPGNRVSLIEGR